MSVSAKDKLLILDLDETLVYATEEPLERPADFCVGPYQVYRRPYAENFLAQCLDWFRVAVWTSSSPLYAQGVTQALFAETEALAFLWASDKCTPAYDLESGELYSKKSLKKVKQKGYALESVIALDDSPQKWQQSYGNLILVKPYVGAEDDQELPRLLVYLETLRRAENVRAVDKRGWRLRH